MALWNNCGNGFVKSSVAKCNLGADAYLCCPGPSLANLDPTTLKIPGVFTFALNTAYPYVKPDVWIGMDGAQCYDRCLWREPFMKICRGGFQSMKCDDLMVSSGCNVHFADLEKFDIPLMFNKRAHDVKFCWQKDTLTTALHIMIWMGAKKIHLVGCDLGGPKDYYDDRVLSDTQRDFNHRLYRVQETRLKEFARVAGTHNIELLSCTEGSPVNKFLKYVPVEDALQESGKFAPQKPSNVIHAHLAQHCHWSKDPRQEQGIVVGCAPMHEDLIEWWVTNYLKYNDYPLAFADFGLSQKGKDLCSKYGKVINMTDVDVEGWFRKPFAILRAPFKKIIWFDVDVEIKGNLQILFPYANDGKVGAGIDSYNAPCFRTHLKGDQILLDSGIIITEYGNPMIKKWAERIAGACKGMYQGDHEVLSEVLYDNGFPFNPLPKHLHRMRLDGCTCDALLFHWTGPHGKEHIRKGLMKCSA